MGFASGREAVDQIWDRIKPYIGRKDRQSVAEILVEEFENLDCDDWDYEKGSVYATARPEEVNELDG